MTAKTLVAAAPTEYRPNGDMPFAWLVLTAGKLALCSSHRTPGIYATHAFEEINEVRLEGGRVLRVLLNDPSSSDLVIPMHPGLPLEEVSQLVFLTQRPKN